MSVNSSAPSDVSVPLSPLSSSNNIFHQLQNCFNFTAVTFSITTFTITNILILLPLYIFVLYLGFQRWRQQRSGQTMSHSDVFTFHMIVTELISVFGSTLITCSSYTDAPQMLTVGIYLFFMFATGQMLFHILTCVERYLAVVHPITYLSLKKTNGIRVRNVGIVCAWLLCPSGIGLMYVKDQVTATAMSYCMIVVSLTVVSFCSLSVLYVLIRPGPGEGGGGRQQVDQSKLKAFYTIMAILGVLLVRFGGNLIATVLCSPQLSKNDRCALWFSFFWFSLPSSLVSPLLFLQRAGKLLCCKKNNKSGQGPD